VSVRLAVVLATRGRPARLGPLLSDLVVQLGVDDQVWVIDQSVGAAAEAGRAAVDAVGDGRVRWEWRSRPGLPGARNQGIARSSGEVVWFVDDDVRLHPGCLEAHRAAYADPSVGGVVGRIVELRLRNNADELVNRVGRGGRIRTCLDVGYAGEVATLKGANMSLRRCALHQAGPFDEHYRGTALLEDADLSTRVRRLGWVLRYVPGAAVDHHHDPVGGVRVGGARQRLAWRLHNTAYFVRRHRGRRDLPALVATQGAVAARHAVVHRDPSLLLQGLQALGRGWRAGGQRAR